MQGIHEHNRSVFDGTSLPLMVVHREALEHNIATMAAFARDHGMELAPHAKTHMSREIATMQLEAGAWALTVATARQAMAVREFGAARVMVANQVVDPAGLRVGGGGAGRGPGLRLPVLRGLGGRGGHPGPARLVAAVQRAGRARA